MGSHSRKHLFKAGARVTIVDCDACPELNGSEAIVVSVLDYYEAVTDQFVEDSAIKGQNIAALNNALKRREDSKYFYVLDLIGSSTKNLKRVPEYFPQSKLKRIYPTAEKSFEDLIKDLRNGKLEPLEPEKF